ncbi:MAG: hypothetical protein JRJ86_21890 [Deltaproteobacteria bacterium]|nr:hypothetical protein [Deltaproteobacteria bacterium]MCD6297253.1 hypothetical protein [Deltaproteobacteria bacterium]
MAQILIRNIEENVVDRLKKRAALHRRSLQAEVKIILEQTDHLDMASSLKVADRIRKKLKGRPVTDSVELLREDRY